MDDVPILRLTSSYGILSQFCLFISLFGLIHDSLLVCGDSFTNQSNLNNTSIDITTGPVDIRVRCPGIEYLMNHNQRNMTLLQANMSKCIDLQLKELPTYSEVVYGVCEKTKTFCFLPVDVPQGMAVRARIQRLAHGCHSDPWIMRIFYDPSDTGWYLMCSVYFWREYYLESDEHHMYIYYVNSPEIKINIAAVKRHSLLIVYTSAYSGYVILSVQLTSSKHFRDVSGEVKAPHGYIIMVSFQGSFQAYCSNFPGRLRIELTYKTSNTDCENVMHVSDDKVTPANILLASRVQIHSYFLRKYHYIDSDRSTVKIRFSFHSDTDQPQQLPKSLFNCSVDHYPSFQHHLDCNLKPECENGQDETEDCPFSSPGCQGLVASRNKCFKYIMLESALPFGLARYECHKIDGQLASIKTSEELHDFLHIFKEREHFCVLTGFSLGWNSVPFMYSAFSKWSDKTLIYNANHFARDFHYLTRVNHTAQFTRHILLLIGTFESVRANEIVCETKSQSEKLAVIQTVEFSVSQTYLSSLIQTKQVLLLCPDGRVVHAFLSCNPNTYCKNKIHSQLSMFWSMNIKNSTLFPVEQSSTAVLFKCKNDSTTVHYSLVCDFREDCPDNSDESFCEHPPCKGFPCKNDQCVWNSQSCNGMSDCLDDSDESRCIVDIGIYKAKKQHLFINLDGTGYFTQHAMEAEKSCPGTHYWCRYDWLYCLPVYTRCNGFSDCTYGEDEEDCETFTCPGFYQCSTSKVCVHGDHLCDGWGQCPQRDDEWLCNTNCPEGCLCQGRSFVCPQPFPAGLFPILRYVNTAGSGMTLTDFNNNIYLIHLSLSNCSLVAISNGNLPNLHLLDITYNQLRTINMNVFLELYNLRTLTLANNPLISLTSKPFSIHFALKHMDLSGTHLESFNNDLFLYLPNLKLLNVSFSSINKIGSSHFRNIPQLIKLDIRGNPVIDIPVYVILELYHLRHILSSNFRFCCGYLLHNQSDHVMCLAPEPIFSVCESLIPTEFLRIFFWVVSTFASLGNLICFVTVLIKKETFTSHFTMFTAQLQMASISMGIQVSIVTAANEILHGAYINFEKAWTSSVPCKMAGFLSILSNEVTVLIIWFMTLYHIILICFPFTKWKFNKSLTIAECVVTWFVGTMMSVIPFLPALAHWGLDGQSGLCRLAVFEDNSSQDIRWFTVTVIFNIILCSMIASGQVIIHRRTPVHLILTDSAKRSVFSSVPLMSKLAIADVLRWFPLGLISVIPSRHVLDEVHVAIVVFMLPLTATLSPLLYVWSVASMQWQRAQEDRLLKVLKSRLSLSNKN